MDQKEFGLFFAKMREKSGFKSQRQLSLASGISNGTIARIESGTQKPTPETIRTLSAYLKATSYEELMYRAGYIDFLEIPDELVEKIGKGEISRDDIAAAPVYKEGRLGAVYELKEQARLRFFQTIEERLGVDFSDPKVQEAFERFIEGFFALEQERNKEK